MSYILVSGYNAEIMLFFFSKANVALIKLIIPKTFSGTVCVVYYLLNQIALKSFF